MRKAIENLQLIRLNNNDNGVIDEFTIINTCGVGASSIVYDAYKKNGDLVKIKELFPIIPNCKRSEDGLVITANKKQFDNKKIEFRQAYELNKEIRSDKELINSTINAEGIYEGNGTLYIVYTNNEGSTLQDNPASSLTELLTILISVSKVIKKYHDRGYLYLDIKPSNILRIPETDQLIIMFDFDSVVNKENLLRGGNVTFSYSPQWAAPELKQGNLNRICEATDVFSIGCILFNYIFGRGVTLDDRSIDSEWNYNSSKKEIFINISPVIFKKLDDFFHKTLTSRVDRRFQTMTQVIDALTILLVISEEKLYINPRIIKPDDDLIVNNDFLLILDDSLQSKNIVALFGIDGIGKTENAKLYVDKYKDKYETIVMIDYTFSLRDSILSDDLSIKNYQIHYNKNNDDAAVYKDKYNLLINLFKPNDLLIIDNFKFNSNDNFKDLQSFPCKIILTTTSDLTDYGIYSIEVTHLNYNNCHLLFKKYNGIIYDTLNQTAIDNIFKRIGYNTIEIILIAKYLKSSGMSPESLLKYRNILKHTDGVPIKIKNNGHILKGDLPDILYNIYNLSNLTDDEKEILQGLSLIKNYKISLKSFESLFKWKENHSQLDDLKDKGWIKTEIETNKIYIHPQIQEAILMDIPSTSSCSRFLKSVISEYHNTSTKYEKTLWKRIIKELNNSNISGDDVLRGDLYMYDGSSESLKKAIKIFSDIGNLNKLSKAYSYLLGLEIYDNIIHINDNYLRSLTEIENSNIDAIHLKSVIEATIMNKLKNDFINKKGIFPFEFQIDYLLDICNELCSEKFDKVLFDYEIITNNIILPTMLAKYISDLLYEYVFEYISNYNNSNKNELITKLEHIYRDNIHSIFLGLYLKYEKKYILLYDKLKEVDNNISFDSTLDIHDEYAFNNRSNEDDYLKREDVIAIMKITGADDDRYYYYRAMVDSNNAISEVESYKPWIRAYYDYMGKFLEWSFARESTVECLEEIPAITLFEKYPLEFCEQTLFRERYDLCRECYTRTIVVFIKQFQNDSKRLFEVMKQLLDYAKRSNHDDDAICCIMLMIIQFIDITIIINDNTNILFDFENLQLTFKESLKNHIKERKHIDDIRTICSENRKLQKNERFIGIFEMIFSFLNREMVIDIDHL